VISGSVSVLARDFRGVSLHHHMHSGRGQLGARGVYRGFCGLGFARDIDWRFRLFSHFIGFHGIMQALYGWTLWT
jgi:hypothetical protein